MFLAMVVRMVQLRLTLQLAELVDILILGLLVIPLEEQLNYSCYWTLTAGTYTCYSNRCKQLSRQLVTLYHNAANGYQYGNCCYLKPMFLVMVVRMVRLRLILQLAELVDIRIIGLLVILLEMEQHATATGL